MIILIVWLLANLSQQKLFVDIVYVILLTQFVFVNFFVLFVFGQKNVLKPKKKKIYSEKITMKREQKHDKVCAFGR